MIRSLINRTCLIATLTFAASVNADSLLNGIASHSELNKEKFIGALYTNTPTTDAAQALSTPPPMRMEIRVVAPKLSKRRFNRMWIEGIAINASGSVLTHQADNMAKFTGLLKKKLVQGDVLELKATADQGTVVVLNQTELGNINDPEFFSLLLKTWIGKVPLSSTFRDGILAGGDTDSELVARFEAIAPSEERIAAVASWLEPAPIPAEVAAASAAVAAPAVSAPKITPPKASPSATTASQSKVAIATPAMPEIAPPSVAFNTSAEPPKSTPKPKVQKPAPPTVETAEINEDEDDEVFTASSLLARQLYISQMLRSTYRNIKYPRRSLERGEQGSVRLSVIVDRSGELKAILPLEESQYSRLNKAAWSAVEKTEFPPMPDEISGDEFEFSMPIVFKLKER